MYASTHFTIKKKRWFKTPHLDVQDWFAWPALLCTACTRCTLPPCLLSAQRMHVLLVLFSCLHINVGKVLLQGYDFLAVFLSFLSIMLSNSNGLLKGCKSTFQYLSYLVMPFQFITVTDILFKTLTCLLKIRERKEPELRSACIQ